MATEHNTTVDEKTLTNSKQNWLGRQGMVAMLLGFWALWFTIVFLTNFFDGLAELGVVSEGWTFRSGNYLFLVDVMGTHNTPETIVGIVFAIGVIWELAAAGLLWWAFAGFLSGNGSIERMYAGMLVAVGFFAGFLVLTEVFMAYDLADTHVRLIVATLVSAFVLDRWWD